MGQFRRSALSVQQVSFHEMARFLQRFSPNSRPIQSEPGWRADVGNVMNKDSNGTFGIIIGGVVAVIAAIFILSGGELGGKKTVEGDQDLPPVATTDK
jgi:hypothetical protein